MIVNGEKIELFKEISLKEFLEKRNFSLQKVAVELNGEIVPKNCFQTVILKENDKIEVVSFVGGG